MLRRLFNSTRGLVRLAFLAPVAVIVALSGCGDSVEQKTLPAEQPKEITEANNNMENFMKTQGKNAAK